MMQKCNFVGCEAQGEPEEGFDFFVCEKCLDELERLISQLQVEKIAESN